MAETLDDLRRKLAKSKNQPGFKARTEELERRIRELENERA